MNRFIPDSLLEALLRPLAMGAPNGWVYLEVMAPDLRFLFIGVLLVLCALFARKARAAQPVLWALVLLLAVAFVPWLVTSGNGRYFIPMLVLAGIVGVALAHALPFSRGLRLSLALGMVAVQGFAVSQNNPWNPWNPWGFAEWRGAPYYPVVLDDEARTRPATYVTLSAISYSLIAPQFAPQSRWVNLSAFLGAANDSVELQRARAILTSAERLRVVLPAASMAAGEGGQPAPGVLRQMGRFMAVHHLRFSETGGGCRLLPLRDDPTESGEALRQPVAAGAPDAEPPQRTGFWICEAAYFEPPPRPEAPMDPRQLEVFAVLERTCPRLFPGGLQKVTPIPAGLMRHYASADMKVYVFKNGSVSYKYHRALNFVPIGTVEDILDKEFRMRCDQIPGRSGLPWEREI